MLQATSYQLPASLSQAPQELRVLASHDPLVVLRPQRALAGIHAKVKTRGSRHAEIDPSVHVRQQAFRRRQGAIGDQQLVLRKRERLTLAIPHSKTLLRSGFTTLRVDLERLEQRLGYSEERPDTHCLPHEGVATFPPHQKGRRAISRCRMSAHSGSDSRATGSRSSA